MILNVWLTYNLQDGQCSGCGEKRRIGGHLTRKVPRKAEANVAYEYLSGIWACYLKETESKKKNLNIFLY